jgi:hypothetical protein
MDKKRIINLVKGHSKVCFGRSCNDCPIDGILCHGILAIINDAVVVGIISQEELRGIIAQNELHGFVAEK